MKRSFHRFLFAVAAFGSVGLLISSGCDRGTSPAGTPRAVASGPVVPDYSQTPRADVDFEAPYRLKTSSGQFVEVESPGYACPTLADVDQDGDEDLIVGQFTNGNMQLYRNAAGADATPSYGQQEWIVCGDQRARVPGVS